MWGKEQNVLLLIIALLSFSLHCGSDPSYTMDIGRSFYPLDQLSYERFFGQDLLRNKAGETIRLRGIYTIADSVFIDFPMLRLYTAGSGLHYALIDTGLNAQDGDLVEVEGTVVRKTIRLKGTKVTYKEELLSSDAFRILHPSHKIKSRVQREYSKIRDELQERITPEGSNLILSENPRWFVVWSETDDMYIVSGRFIDLMYQAEVDFVFCGSKQTLTDVYAVEWFKGE
ncbi:MAG: hypothetical protein JSV84_16245 [Gemmatimonadota bacterium]|nr:MAG: hypothetical protein JSV84_16245 [Gemmatimonadota bacterium]